MPHRAQTANTPFLDTVRFLPYTDSCTLSKAQWSDAAHTYQIRPLRPEGNVLRIE